MGKKKAKVSKETPTIESEAKSSKPKINPVKRFAFLVMLIIFVPGTIYFLATFQFLAFFILAAATFIIIQILNWKFKEN